MKQDIVNILSMLCKRKEVNIVEAEICPDHVHMLVEIPPKMNVSDFVGYLKGKSTLMIFERHANLKFAYIIFVSAKDRLYNVITGKIQIINLLEEQRVKTFDDVIKAIG